MITNEKLWNGAEVFIDKGTKFYVGNTETKPEGMPNQQTFSVGFSYKF